MKKKCPLCETENELDARFCIECNEPIYNINILKEEKGTDTSKYQTLKKELEKLYQHPKRDDKLIRLYENEINKIEDIFLNRNLEGKALGKEGKIDEAIKLYEKNIKEEFEGNFPYDSLTFIYRKMGLIDEEIRVLEKAVWVFENVVYKGRADRLPKLERFKQWLEEANKRKSIT